MSPVVIWGLVLATVLGTVNTLMVSNERDILKNRVAAYEQSITDTRVVSDAMYAALERCETELDILKEPEHLKWVPLQRGLQGIDRGNGGMRDGL